MEQECVFCGIIEGEIPAEKVFENDKWVAFLDAEPVSKGHTLVVPRDHVEDIHEAEEMDFMWDALVKTSNAIKEAFEPEGINIHQNNGEVAGQEVFHMHFHVTPRYSEEEIRIEYDRSELKDGGKVAERIRSKMT